MCEEGEASGSGWPLYECQHTDSMRILLTGRGYPSSGVLPLLRHSCISTFSVRMDGTGLVHCFRCLWAPHTSLMTERDRYISQEETSTKQKFMNLTWEETEVLHYFNKLLRKDNLYVNSHFKPASVILYRHTAWKNDIQKESGWVFLIPRLSGDCSYSLKCWRYKLACDCRKTDLPMLCKISCAVYFEP